MRVALLADFPVHTLSGFEDHTVGYHATWLYTIATALETQMDDMEIHWLTCTKTTTKTTTLSSWNQTFHLLPRRKLSFEMLTSFRRERLLIARLLADLKPDLVHGWGTEQGYGYAANDFTGSSIISIQGILNVCCQAAPMPWLTRLQALHEARILGQAKHLTVESPWGQSQLRQLAPQAEIDLLEYGVSHDCFATKRQPSDKPLALFVGTLAWHKGVDTLLSAFSDPRLRNVELVVLGSGSAEFTHCQRPANIRLLGHRSPAEVREWMAKAWCLVHPTRADTSPNCVKEARVIGIPVVTTPNGGQTQYVTHGQSGYLHEAGDFEGLIDGVLTLTADRETNLRIGATGQAKCRAALKPETTATRLLKIYTR